MSAEESSVTTGQHKLLEHDPLCAPKAGHSVVVAMSGGVDSSVAAHMLREVGWNSVGVSMQVWDYRQHQGSSSRATCCSPADFCDARRVANKIGIPFYVLDFEEHFRREVIDKFVKTYEAGLTPNPCIDCNSKVKFRELRVRAESFGSSHVATGHYARIRKSDEGFHLLRGRDLDKDQSYFLYTCKQEELSKTLFPIGHFTKPEIREFAREAGLVTADKAESQDICFVAGSVTDFVTRIGGKRVRGEIVSVSGEKLGEHDGIQAFTVGQRRGVGIGGNSEPLYVVEIDPKLSRVVIGPKEHLQRESFGVEELNLINPEIRSRVLKGESPVEFESVVQVRSRHRGVKATVRIDSPDSARVLWRDQWAVVSPGQAAVFYDLKNEEVLGGGRIVK